MNVERSPDTDGTAALFKSMQARDKDACLVRCCFVRYFIFPLIGQCQRGEHGRMVVRLDLIFMMACHHFWFLSGADDILIFPTFSHEIIRLPFLPSVLLAIEQSGWVICANWTLFFFITTPLRGGKGKNVTIHFNVCKTSLLENWKKSKRTSPTDHPAFFRVKRQNVILKYVRSTCYFFPFPSNFVKSY